MRVAPVDTTGRYFVTDEGEIINARGRILRPHLNQKTGYFQLGLRFEPGRAKCCRVHRLVAKAFVPNPAGLCEVNHIDGNKQNNRASNLEWTDKSRNAIHAYRLGLRHTTAVVAYTKDGELFRTFPSVKEAMTFCGVSYNASISRCLRGAAPTAHGYVWKYAEGGAET